LFVLYDNHCECRADFIKPSDSPGYNLLEFIHGFRFDSGYDVVDAVHGGGFLYAFYRAGHMHQIRHLSIKPMENGRGLDLVITIEALSLPGATLDKLSTEPGTRLMLSSADAYSNLIVGRNLFSPYAPKHETTPASPNHFDPCKYAYLTAILAVGARPQAWFVARATDQVFKLSEGEEFAVGTVRPKIVRIHSRSVELEIDGARYQVRLGTSLGERQPLSGGGNATAQ